MKQLVDQRRSTRLRQSQSKGSRLKRRVAIIERRKNALMMTHDVDDDNDVENIDEEEDNRRKERKKVKRVWACG